MNDIVPLASRDLNDSDSSHTGSCSLDYHSVSVGQHGKQRLLNVRLHVGALPLPQFEVDLVLFDTITWWSLTLVGLIRVFLNKTEAICFASGLLSALSSSNTRVVRNLFYRKMAMISNMVALPRFRS